MIGFSHVNVSTDSDQPVAPARLYQGHWRHQFSPYGEAQLCRILIDVAEPRVVSAQVMENGLPQDLGTTALEDLTAALVAQDAHFHPTAWGLTECAMMPRWATGTFSESQIHELERIEGYLIEASEDTFDDVLYLRDEFLRALGMTQVDACKALREAKNAQGPRKSGRYLVN